MRSKVPSFTVSLQKKLKRNDTERFALVSLKSWVLCPRMDKKTAAEFLGVSTRLVERYASEGRLGTVQYIRGKTGKQADYNDESVKALKEILESPDTAIVKGQTVRSGPVYPGSLATAF